MQLKKTISLACLGAILLLFVVYIISNITYIETFALTPTDKLYQITKTNYDLLKLNTHTYNILKATTLNTLIDDLNKKARIRTLNKSFKSINSAELIKKANELYPLLNAKDIKRLKAELFPVQSTYGYNPDKINAELICKENYWCWNSIW
jgi:hypothetical protein